VAGEGLWGLVPLFAFAVMTSLVRELQNRGLLFEHDVFRRARKMQDTPCLLACEVDSFPVSWRALVICNGCERISCQEKVDFMGVLGENESAPRSLLGNQRRCAPWSDGQLPFRISIRSFTYCQFQNSLQNLFLFSIIPQVALFQVTKGATPEEQI
jgi:hypothetical protein